MQCKEVQGKFIPFINDELNHKELKEFLAHIRQCKDCQEEYDIYYTMIMGMRYLESDNNKTELEIDSEQRIREAEDYLLQYKILQAEKIILFVVLCIGLVLLL
ncbi:MAG: zf-HC2 domain-containing protein [Lachnospiraceae bacterium]